MKTFGILAFTQRGGELASKLAAAINEQNQAEIFNHEISAKAYLEENFHRKDCFLFICAAGIAVRLIAPLIQSKDVDPAVLVMDELGHHMIPILSGHLGGANETAAEIAALTGCDTQVVLTTATDINEKFAVDVWTRKAGCKILNIGTIKEISAAVLRGEKVGIFTGFPIEGDVPEELTLKEAEAGMCISLSGDLQPFPKTLNVVPKIVTLGVGCRKNADSGKFEEFVLQTLADNHVSIEAVEQIASINLKQDEACILSFSRKYNIPFVTYSAEELMEAPGDFNVSEFVRSVTGADNVCERSACLGSRNGRKILTKTSHVGFTAAMAMRDWKCKF